MPVVCEIAYVCEQWQSLCAFCERKSFCLLRVAKVLCLLCVNSGKLVCLLCAKELMYWNSGKASVPFVRERAYVCEEWQSLPVVCEQWESLCACCVWTQ